MKVGKKIVAVVTMAAMAFNVVIPAQTNAKENKGYTVIANDDVKFEGSGQILGDLYMNGGKLSYGSGGEQSVTGTAYTTEDVTINRENQWTPQIDLVSVENRVEDLVQFDGKAYPDENSKCFKNTTSEYKDGTQSLLFDWQTQKYVLEDNGYFDRINVANGWVSDENEPYYLEIRTKKDQTVIIRAKHLFVGSNIKVTGEGKAVIYVDQMADGNYGTINAGGKSSQLTIVFTGKKAGYNNYKEVNANTIAMNAEEYIQNNGKMTGNVYTTGNITMTGDGNIVGKVYAQGADTFMYGSARIDGQLVTDKLIISGGAKINYKETNGFPSGFEDVVGDITTKDNTDEAPETVPEETTTKESVTEKATTENVETTTKEEVSSGTITEKPSDLEESTTVANNETTKADVEETTKDNTTEDNQDTDDNTTNKKVTVSVVVPKRMSIRLEDGTVLKNKDSFTMELDKEVKFQMCSNNWDNDTYSDDGNGIAGTVVYSAIVNSKARKNSYIATGHQFVISKGDKVLRTDVNRCFMAYRFYFKGENYNKQTGIKNVVNTPLESLSVNLPLGSTITCDAYKAYSLVDSKDVFIETGDDKRLSYKDYYWNID